MIISSNNQDPATRNQYPATLTGFQNIIPADELRVGEIIIYPDFFLIKISIFARCFI
jgi:hypothetical protein